MKTLCAHVPPARFGLIEERTARFADGYTTVLFFDDTAVNGEFEGLGSLASR
ncbi:MAG: hypothetical protein LBU24_05605 [Methanocalculaceae archaeon]|nr:hypothetical protein [Methanocalculaceae archaeon]